MSEVVIQVPPGLPPQQIEGFPETKSIKGKDMPFERSCKGALHLKANSTKVITKDEHTYIQEKYPRLDIRVLKVIEDKKPAKAEKSADDKPSKEKAIKEPLSGDK
jgi:hypothetical protein